MPNTDYFYTLAIVTEYKQCLKLNDIEIDKVYLKMIRRMILRMTNSDKFHISKPLDRLDHIYYIF